MSDAQQQPTGATGYLRKWEIKVSLTDGGTEVFSIRSFPDPNDSNDPGPGPNALRATFDIVQPGYVQFWYGDIVLYNLNTETTEMLLRKDMSVTVSAGYENGNYGQIFKGRLFQPFWERDNVVDFKMTLHCVIGPDKLGNNFVSFAQSAYATQAQIIQRIVEESLHPLGNLTLPKGIKETQFPRAQTVFGTPDEFLSWAAADNKYGYYVDDDGLTFDDLSDDATSGNLYTYSPPSLGGQVTEAPGTIIGVPQQTQEGISFRVLLDSRLKVQYPPDQVKIDNSSIRFLKAQIGQKISILDKDGIYKVAAVRHVGDTRGQQWYTEVHGVTNAALLLLGYGQ